MQVYVNIHQNSNKFEIINYVEQKILELAVHWGIKCALDNNCKYIYIHKNNMKKHWN